MLQLLTISELATHHEGRYVCVREAIENHHRFPIASPVNNNESYTLFPSLLTRLFHLSELARRLTLNDDGNLQRLGFPL